MYIDRLYKERDRSGQVHSVLQNANKLDEIKKFCLQEHALGIVRQVKQIFLTYMSDLCALFLKINDSSYETKIKNLINKINQEIRESFFNIIFFLRSSPLITHQLKSPITPQNSVQETSSATFINTSEIQINSFFKSDLIHSLKDTQKTLHLKFEVLTLKSLTEAFDSGCRIIQLSLDIAHEEGLVAEDSQGAPFIITYQHLTEIIEESRLKTRKCGISNKNGVGERNVELILLASKNNTKLAEFFSKEVGVPYVITFNFKPRDGQEIRINSRLALYESEFIDKFCMFFFVELVEGRAVEKAFDAALRNTFDCIAFSFFLGKEAKVKELLGEGATLLLSSDDLEARNRKLFENEEFRLPNGILEDISTVLSPTNIHKSIIPFIGRRDDIYEISKLLAQGEKTNFLKVSGEPGSGKTRLVLEAAYYMLVRNLFPDGIFYFPLRKYWKANLLDMIKKALNSETYGSRFEKNITNVFRNKKMLLIFDDFDSFYENIAEFPYLIFSVLQICQISTIVVTTTQSFPNRERSNSMPKSEVNGDSQSKIESEFIKSSWKLQRLSLEESGALVSAITEIEYGVRASTEEIIKLNAVKQAKGNPSKLIKLIREEKIVVDDQILKINPIYEIELEPEKHHKEIVKKPRCESERAFAMNLSRHSTPFYRTFLQQEIILKYRRSLAKPQNSIPLKEYEQAVIEAGNPRLKPRTKTLEAKIAQEITKKLGKALSFNKKSGVLNHLHRIPKESSEDEYIRENLNFDRYGRKPEEKSKPQYDNLDQEDEPKMVEEQEELSETTELRKLLSSKMNAKVASKTSIYTSEGGDSQNNEIDLFSGRQFGSVEHNLLRIKLPSLSMQRGFSEPESASMSNLKIDLNFESKE